MLHCVMAVVLHRVVVTHGCRLGSRWGTGYEEHGQGKDAQSAKRSVGAHVAVSFA